MFKLYGERLKVLKSDFNASLYSIIVFIFSIIFSPLFINGDQEAYRDFYSNCFSYVGLNSQFSCYSSTLGSQEPIYFILVKFFHYFLDKDLLISLVNALLVFLLVKIVYIYILDKKSIHLLILLILFNYYTFVLFFSAERLKFSLVFLLLSFLLMGWKSYFLKLIMVLTHIQTIFIFLIQVIYRLISKEKNKNKILINFIIVLVTTVTFTIIFLYLRDHIESKFITYSQGLEEKGGGFLSLIKALFFCLIAYISTRKFTAVVLQIPLVVGALILGSDRFLIMSFFVYLGSLIYFKGRIDLFCYIILFYFAIKSFDFWDNAFKYGTGFSIS